VEYQPVKEDDEEIATQATEYINVLVFPESDGPDAVHDAVDDSLRLRNGIIKWWQDERTEIKYSEHTGLDDMAFAQLVEGDDVEVLAHTARMEEIEQDPGLQPQMPQPPGIAPGQPMGEPGEAGPQPMGEQQQTVHDVKIRTKCKKSRAKMAAIPMDNFLIHTRRDVHPQ